MRKSRYLFLALLTAFILPSAVAFAQISNVWVATTANTPDAAYDWSSAEHWNTSSGPSDGCYIKVYPSSKVFIRPSSDIAVQYFYANGNVYFLGDTKVASCKVGNVLTRGCLYSGAWHFGDVIFPQDDTMSPWISGPKFCGRIRHGHSSQTITVSSGTVDFYFDRYARSSSAVRTDDFDDFHNFYVGNGTISFHAPCGAPEIKGVWRLTAGSPFAYRVSAVAHPLAVGTLVAAGEALSEETFLKHVFTDSIIELSTPALASGEIELSFAEFKPKFVATLPEKFTAGGADVKLCAFRNSIEDDVCVSFANGVYCGYAAGKLTLGFVDDKIPAVMRLGPITGSCKNGGIYLRNSHLAFENGVSFSANHPVKMPSTENGSFTSRFTVTDGQSVEIASLVDFAGTIVKDGEGILKIGLDDAANAGSFSVEGGRLEIAKNSSAGEGDISFGSISLADGATFVLPSGVVTVETFRATGMATVSGGKIVAKSLAGSDLRELILLDGAEIEFLMSLGENSCPVDVSPVAISGVSLNVPENESLSVFSATNGTLVKKGGGILSFARYEGASIDVREGEVVLSTRDRDRFVPADSWLHVDAAEEETLETEEDGVTLERWRGLAGSGECLTNHLPNNSEPFYAKVQRNALNNLPLVDLGPQRNNNGLQAASLKYEGSHSTRMVKTGFAVYDSSAGGSAVFGSVGNEYPTRGLPNDMKSTNMICEATYAAGNYAKINVLSNAVADGSAVFRRNGEVIDPFRTGFLLGPERFSFRYPAGRVTEHFGAYGQSSQYRGGLKIGELILFDRVLADEEMESVEAYLAKKWFNIATPGYGSEVEDVQVAPDATLRVTGSGFKSNALSGGGTIVGDVELAPQGILRVVPASDGIVDCLTFAGTLTLGGGVVEIPDDEKTLAFGDHVLVSAAKITNKGGEWTLPVSARRNYTLIISNTQVILSVRKRGLSIICR